MTSSIAVLGIDPGSRWTGGCLVVDGDPLDGWTIGPTGPDGEPQANALDDLNDVQALARYVTAVVDAAVTSADLVRDAFGVPLTVAVEGVRVPRGGSSGRVPLRDWVTPRCVLAAVAGTFPAAVILPAGAGGTGRPREEYPEPLRRRRPSTWGANMARRGERDHERSAYDLAMIVAGNLAGQRSAEGGRRAS